MPYEIVSGDLSAVTFAVGPGWNSGISQAEWKPSNMAALIPMLCQPILARWSELAAALGYVDGEAEQPRWACPSPQALDARMEVQTDIQRVRAGFASRSEVVERDGFVIDDIDAEIAADQRRARALGLTLDVDSRMTQQGQEQPQTVTQEDVP